MTDPPAEPLLDPDSDPPGVDLPEPDALGSLGEAVRSAELLLPHPVERMAERGRHELEPPHDLGLIARFDRSVDQAFDQLRGNPVADRLFYGATELGDFGLIWVLIGATQALGGDRQIARAGRLTATLAVESVVVNGVIKSLLQARAAGVAGAAALQDAHAAHDQLPERPLEHRGGGGHPALRGQLRCGRCTGAWPAWSPPAASTFASTTPATSSAAWPPDWSSALAARAFWRRLAR